MDLSFTYAGHSLVNLVKKLDGDRLAIAVNGPWFFEHDNHEKLAKQWEQYCRGFSKMLDELVVANVRHQWRQNEPQSVCSIGTMPWALIGHDHPMVHQVETVETDPVPLRFRNHNSEPIIPYGHRIGDDGEHWFISSEWDNAPLEACFWAQAKPRPVAAKINVEYVINNTYAGYGDRGQLRAQVAFGKEQAPAHWFIVERKTSVLQA